MSLGNSIDIDGQIILGDNVVIGDDIILSCSTVGNNTRVGIGSEILGSMVWDNVTIGWDSVIKENILGS